DIKLLVRALRLLLDDSRDIVTARGMMATELQRSESQSQRRGIDASPGGPANTAPSSPPTTDMKAATKEPLRTPAGDAKTADRTADRASFSLSDGDITPLPPTLQPTATPSESSAPNTVSETKPAVDATCSGNLDPQAIARVTKELARYI